MAREIGVHFGHNFRMKRQKVDQKITFVTYLAQLARLDSWRGKQRPIPSRNEVIRRAIDQWLDTAGEPAVEDESETEKR